MTRKSRKTHYQKYKHVIVHKLEQDLLEAIKDRDLSLLRHVLKHLPKRALNKKLADGSRPWHYLKYDFINASESVLREMVQLLHCAGADFTLTRKKSMVFFVAPITLFQELSRSHHDQNIFVAKALVDLGIDVNKTPNAENGVKVLPPLVLCFHCNWELGKILIEKTWADWTVFFNQYTSTPRVVQFFGCSLEKRIRRDLIYVALGLRALDLPVLCVLEIFDWISDQRYTSKPSAVTRWAIASKIKHFPIE